jgi:hypothetical protein
MHMIVKLPSGPNPEVVEALASQIRKTTLSVVYHGNKVGSVIDVAVNGVDMQVTLELTSPVPEKFRLMFSAAGTTESPVAQSALMFEE